MKKLLIAAAGLLLLFAAGCAKVETSGISIQELMDEVKTEVDFDNAKTEDLTDKQVAARYGINPDNIKEGLVYHSTDEDNADVIVLVRAKDRKATEQIESAFSRERLRLSDIWDGKHGENDRSQNKKIEKHIRKTRGEYVALIVCEKAKEVVKIFDGLV